MKTANTTLGENEARPGLKELLCCPSPAIVSADPPVTTSVWHIVSIPPEQ